MRKNEINAYNELNKAIGRIGELKNAIIESDGDIGIKFRDTVEAIKVTLEMAVEEYNTKARPKDEVRQDIIDNLTRYTYETYDLILDWDDDYQLREDVDDVFDSAGELLDSVDIDDIERLKDGETFIYKDWEVIFADTDDVVAMVMEDPDDFIEFLADNRDDDEGDLNELLAEYENAEE